MAEESSSRPRRVVIIDEDKPWVETTDEFYSREDHEWLLVGLEAFVALYVALAVRRTSRPASVHR